MTAEVLVFILLKYVNMFNSFGDIDIYWKDVTESEKLKKKQNVYIGVFSKPWKKNLKTASDKFSWSVSMGIRLAIALLAEINWA